MRTKVEFVSDLFPAYPDEEDEINPDMWGKRLAEYLHAKLAAQGIGTGESYEDNVFVEDWGVGFHVQNKPFAMWVGCGAYFFENEGQGYLIQLEPSKPFIRKGLFGSKLDVREEVERLASAIDRILRSDPGIRAVRWWTEGEG